MKNGLKRAKPGKLLIQVLFLVVLSCSTEGDIQQVLGKSVEAPVFVDCRPVSSTVLSFRFSTPVKVVSLDFDTAVEIDSVEDGREVKVTFTGPLGEGKKVTADILVEDQDRNTLNVIVPFRTRNDRMPALVFNELRTENTKPKAEFVEFRTLAPGNLGAMRLFIAGHSLAKPAYEFPPAEVQAGEYIVLHLRTVEDGTADETGDNLALSGGTDAQKDARDFWLPGNSKILHKTDALWLVDQDDRIIDAILMSENLAEEWSAKDSKIASAAEYLGREKAWLPAAGEIPESAWFPKPAAALRTTGTTNTRTICRDESIPASPKAGNWYITATSCATPGKPNNPKRY